MKHVQPTPSAATLRIGVVFDLTLSNNAMLTVGVLDYIQKTGLDWSIEVAEVRHHLEYVPPLPGFDGAIVMPPDNALLHQKEFPVVLVRGNSGLPAASVDCVEIDHHRVMEMAARHLAGKGFRHIGMASFAHGQFRNWVVSRENGFRQACGQLGLAADVFTPDPGLESHRAGLLKALAAWLMKPDAPQAVVAANDYLALDVIECCRISGLEVPGDLALVGIDNHPIICPFTSPPLTSIGINYRAIGRRAAALLDERLRNPSAPLRNEPFDDFILFERASTETIAAEDPLVVSGLRFIRDHFAEAVGAREIQKELGISHTALNRRFRSSLHCTVQKCLQAERLRHAKQLLADPQKPMKHIARESGFHSAQYFDNVFRKNEGMTPGQYRERLLAGQKL